MSAASWIVIVLVVLMIAGILHQARGGKYTGKFLPKDAGRASLIGPGLRELHGFLEPDRKAALIAVKDGDEREDPSDSGDGPTP
jgi:hypothetical protein